jgi:hypothetical protein
MLDKVKKKGKRTTEIVVSTIACAHSKWGCKQGTGLSEVMKGEIDFENLQSDNPK